LALLIIYTGLIALGAVYNSEISQEASRTDILIQLSENALGSFGQGFLSVLVALACFTTAVGIITGVADYFRGLFNNSNLVYQIVAIASCVFGVLVGKFNVDFIIQIAFPVLMIIYPVTIVLILLNVIPIKLASPKVFKCVVVVAILFSIPDALNVIFPESDVIQKVIFVIPLANYSLAWVLPSFITFFVANLLTSKR